MTRTYTALQLLHKLRDEQDFEEVSKWANALWSVMTTDGFQDRQRPGQEQADKLKEKLRQLESWWVS